MFPNPMPEMPQEMVDAMGADPGAFAEAMGSGMEAFQGAMADGGDMGAAFQAMGDVMGPMMQEMGVSPEAFDAAGDAFAVCTHGFITLFDHTHNLIEFAFQYRPHRV